MSTKCPVCNTEDSQFSEKCATSLPGLPEALHTDDIFILGSTGSEFEENYSE